MEKNQFFPNGDLEIGRRIQRLRKYMRMTQRELAEKVMVSPSSITRLESGQIMVSVFTIMEIARVLDVPVSAILMEGDDYDEQELAILVEKMKKCTPEQRRKLMQCFDGIVDVLFMEE